VAIAALAVVTTAGVVVASDGSRSPTPDAAAPPAASTPAGTGSAAARTPESVDAMGAASPRPTASARAPRGAEAAAPARFANRPPGSALPSGEQCARWVRAKPAPENKRANAAANRRTGQRVGADVFSGNQQAANRIGARVDGAFTGSTEDILRWAACKWGIDEDVVRAQAAVESWWLQSTLGDWTSDGARCAPGHGLGTDGRAGQCPESFGILQDRHPYQKSAWPAVETSTAMNADLAYAIWRSCFEGYEGWLNDEERGREYAAGDQWGCVGRWFSGRWHTADSQEYIGRVRGYLDRRIWVTPDFQQG
jgi:autotransporter family porin